MAMRPAALGTARLGNFRLGYTAAMAAWNLTRVSILVDGVAGVVRHGSLIIHDILNDAPNTCSLIVDSVAPSVSQALRVSVGTDTPTLLFSGALQTVNGSYDGRASQLVWPCTGIDDTARANRLRPFGTWTNVSATTIAIAITPAGFSTAGVEAGLPAISITFDGSTSFIGCWAQIATLIGGYGKVEDLGVYLFLDDTAAPPDPIDATHPPLDDPQMTVSVDDSQLRTRVYGKGHGETVPIDVAAGVTSFPITDTAMFNAAGGQAITGTTSDGAQSQIIDYTGVSADGGNATVVSGIPQTPGALSATAAAVAGNLTNGTFGYKVTFVNTDGGESEAGSAASAAIGTVSAPGAPSTAEVSNVSGNLTAGAAYQYKCTYVTPNGETAAGSASGGTTIAAVSAPGTISGATYTTGGALVPLTVNYAYGVSYVDAIGETGVGSYTSDLTVTSGNSAIALSSIPTSSDGRVIARRIYRRSSVTPTVGRLIAELRDNTTTTWTDRTDENALGVLPPSSNTSGSGQISVTSIPTSGDGRVTGRKVYRTIAGGSVYLLVQTFVDNSTTSFTDNVADSSLGAPAPAASTANNGKMTLSSIPTGPTGTASRNVYRTLVGGAAYKLAFAIADNATTTFTDNNADSALGVAAPSLSTWHTPAGSTALRVADLAQFSEGFGWVNVNAQVVKFTGRSGSSGPGTLTGIPASGAGAIVAAAPAGSAAIGQPFLKGVTGLALAMQKDAAVHVWVTVNDSTAQTEAAARESTATYTSDGVHEHTIADEQRGEASLIALCEADLALFARPLVTFVYATNDLKTKSGKTVHIDQPGYPVGDYVIQSVDITEIDDAPGVRPKFTVTASSVRFSLPDILRRKLAA